MPTARPRLLPTVVLSTVLLVPLLPTLAAAASVDKAALGAPVAAPASADARSVVTERLDSALRAQSAGCYAGLTQAADGALEVHAVVGAACARVVQDVSRRAELDSHASAGSVRQRDTARFSLSVLEA